MMDKDIERLILQLKQEKNNEKFNKLKKKLLTQAEAKKWWEIWFSSYKKLGKNYFDILDNYFEPALSNVINRYVKGMRLKNFLKEIKRELDSLVKPDSSEPKVVSIDGLSNKQLKTLQNPYDISAVREKNKAQEEAKKISKFKKEIPEELNQIFKHWNDGKDIEETANDLRLPVAAVAHQYFAMKSLLEQKSGSKITSEENIFIIEDEDKWIDEYKKLLKDHDFPEPIVARTYDEAKNIIDDYGKMKDVICIILDIVLPENESARLSKNCEKKYGDILFKKITDSNNMSRNLFVSTSLLNYESTVLNNKGKEEFRKKLNVRRQRGFIIEGFAKEGALNHLRNLMQGLFFHPSSEQLLFDKGHFEFSNEAVVWVWNDSNKPPTDLEFTESEQKFFCTILSLYMNISKGACVVKEKVWEKFYPTGKRPKNYKNTCKTFLNNINKKLKEKGINVTISGNLRYKKTKYCFVETSAKNNIDQT